MTQRMTVPCLDCGRVGISTGGRGICTSCRYRRERDGTLDQRPLIGASPSALLPADRAAFDAYCDASYATFLADVHERMAAGRSLVLAGPGAPVSNARHALSDAMIAAD